MKTTNLKTVVGAVFCATAFIALSAQAAEAPKINALAQRSLDNPDWQTLPTKGVRTLHDYIVQEKELFEFLFKNHPVFKYQEMGRIRGEPRISTRGSEYLGEGNAQKYSKHQPGERPMASQYRLANKSILDYPNKFIGPDKCGECHAIQYERWKRSRHAKTVRFPGEHPEVGNDLKKKIYKDVNPAAANASILPDGIYADVIFATIGTPRTKYGYVDGWLVRGAYHIEGVDANGNLIGDQPDARLVIDPKTGKVVPSEKGVLVAGGCQFSLGWAKWLTPKKAEEINKLIPDFPYKDSMSFGPSGSHEWGMTSYGSAYGKHFLFQPASSYCEVCHAFKFDFKSAKEFYAALGNPKELQKHTISKGISCEECHGAGGHLDGGTGGGLPSNCERCHQRLNFIDPDTAAGKPASKKIELAFNVKTKSSCPSCGTEGAQLFMSKHYEKGMRCTTCHDPHEVTSNDWKDYYTKPSMKKSCKDCHAIQSDVQRKTDTHVKIDCVGCHMPFTMTCENFQAIQRPDMAGFDAVRRSHVWNIKVDPKAKMMDPAEGQSRASSSKGWHMNRDEKGHGYLDLMWSCARTANAEPEVTDNKGCHSPFMSELEKGLQYSDQQQIYDEVMKWQTPVKDAFKKADGASKRIVKLLEVTKLTPNAKTEVMMLLDKAQEILTQVKKDGSWGVHAPKYLKQRVETANAFLDKAQQIMDAGDFPVATAAKK